MLVAVGGLRSNILYRSLTVKWHLCRSVEKRPSGSWCVLSNLEVLLRGIGAGPRVEGDEANRAGRLPVLGRHLQQGALVTLASIRMIVRQECGIKTWQHVIVHGIKGIPHMPETEDTALLVLCP